MFYVFKLHVNIGLKTCQKHTEAVWRLCQMVPVFHLLEEDSTKIVSDNAYTISVIDDYIVYLTVILFI
jgi:hypothetical protein